ncbi:MAG: hypothetical protein KTR21_16525 [Rhodobacteraceae bacterium]|nr:hypothetical protein [Paracoccaceae bacterium]
MRAIAFAVLPLIAGGIFFYLFGDLIVSWANDQQKFLQAELASALVAVHGGDLVAVVTVISVCALYGVVHAIGPGHGKLLIGGAALASRRTAYRMAGIGLTASLVQGATAILLVYGGLGVFSLASRSLIGVSESWLTAASYLAIAAIGGWIFWRGARLVFSLSTDRVENSPTLRNGCAAGCRHTPTPQEAEKADNWRNTLALIASIGVRPCSGALIVLALSWRFEIHAVGAASVIAMALGTGLVVAAVALAAVWLRNAGQLTETGPFGLWSFAAVQLCVGMAILLVSGALAAAALDQSDRAHPLMQTTSDFYR